MEILDELMLESVNGGAIFLAPALYSAALKVGAIGGLMGTAAFIIEQF